MVHQRIQVRIPLSYSKTDSPFGGIMMARNIEEVTHTIPQTVHFLTTMFRGVALQFLLRIHQVCTLVAVFL